MLNYDSILPVRRMQLQMSASSDEEAVVANDVTFGEAEVSFETVAEPEYGISDNVIAATPSVRDYFEEIAAAGFPSVQTSAYIFGKRAFDIVFSVFAIAATSPLLLLITIAIKLTSSGPVFFRQERIGCGGIAFDMLKFRTMRVADKAFTDTAWRANDDPRRTLVGHLLRRMSLDELPQFLNVLRGEMSVVGPRPERPFFVKKFSEEIRHYKLRHKGEVGITGLAQIRGYRGDTCIASRVACDLEYLERWSFKLDLWIIWRTMKRIFVSDHE